MANDKVKYQGYVEGEVMPTLLSVTGWKFRGREVALMKHPPGLFGTRKATRARECEVTVLNGIVNQCSLSDPPTPYWAVMDAMCSLKTGFTKEQVIDVAVGWVGEGKRRACEFAWDVLRNHHRHERKREAGMGFMVDTLDGGKLSIRAREPGETLAYFLGERERRKVAEAMLSGVGIGDVPEKSEAKSEASNTTIV